MKRKSMIALGMAAVLTMGTCVPVLAANNEGNSSSSVVGQTTITAKKDVAFKVSIPATVELSEEQEVIVDPELLQDGLMLEATGTVAIATTSIVDGKLKLTAGETELSVDVASTEVNPKTDAGKWKYTLGKAAFTNAGEYSGTMDFTISYVAKTGA